MEKIFEATLEDKKRVQELIPEIALIQDEELREKVVIALVKSWRESSFQDLSEVPAALDETKDQISQIQHLRAVTLISIRIADVLEEILSFVKIKRDTLIAGAILHDLGKPYEYDPENQAKWSNDPLTEGKPAIRHAVYGVHLALSVGLPVEIAHIMGAHSMEGRYLQRSLPNTIINFADHVFWEVAWKAGFNKVMQYI
jgi:putative nucleotidyltransferase with HDIG domain